MNATPQSAGLEVAGLLREYDLGALIGAEPLAGGSATVVRIRAERGTFVLKLAGRPEDIDLQARASRYLARRGIRQAQIFPTRTGALVSSGGHFLLESLPGTIAVQPSARQTVAAMRYLGAYHRELAGLPHAYLPDASSLWQRVADPEYLVRELPGLLARYRLAGTEELAALDALDQARPGLASLPRQIVHGDIAPDNVLMDGDAVVSVIDFTPYYESVVFGASTALYWYHVHGSRHPSADLHSADLHSGQRPPGRRPSVQRPFGQPSSKELSISHLRRSVAALGEQREWTEAELELWPAGLLREALRRLATPLVAATESGRAPSGPSVANRHAALLALVRALPDLQELSK